MESRVTRGKVSGFRRSYANVDDVDYSAYCYFFDKIKSKKPTIEASEKKSPTKPVKKPDYFEVNTKLRIGEKFQAKIPKLKNGKKAKVEKSKCELMWKASNSEKPIVNEILKKVCQPGEYEKCLQILLASKFDYTEAMRKIRRMRKLGKAEIGNDLFADLMRACGRSFHLFGKQGLGNEDTKRYVEKYYKWKTSRGYRKWKAERDTVEDDSIHEDYCFTCNNGGRLLCCSACTLAFHLECLNPQLTSIPSGEWFCHYCQLEDASIGNSVPRQRNPMAAKPKKSYMQVPVNGVENGTK